MTAFSAKNKLGFVNGTILQPSDESDPFLLIGRDAMT